MRICGGFLEKFDFSSIDNLLKEDSFDFQQIVELLINGQYQELITKMISYARNGLYGAVEKDEKILRQIVLLVLLLGIYTAVAKAFSDKSLSQMGYYVVYLLLITLLLNSFSVGYQLASNLMDKFFSLLVVILPIFYLAVAYAGNQTAATGYYQVTLLILTGMEGVFVTFLFPFIKMYTILSLVNELGEEHYFSQLLILGKKAFQMIMKLLLAGVIGMQVIQGMILPQADAIKNRAIVKVVSTIPGIGGVTQSMSSVLLGSGVLIRNGIGAGAMICLLFICVVPFLQLAIISALFYLCASVISPISDKRVTNCILKTADGISMLLKVMTSCLCIFLVIIASVCVMTGNGVS